MERLTQLEKEKSADELIQRINQKGIRFSYKGEILETTVRSSMIRMSYHAWFRSYKGEILHMFFDKGDEFHEVS